MVTLLNILSILICVWVIWDDFKNREVHLIALSALCISVFIERLFYSQFDWQYLFIQGGVNLIVLTMVFGITYLYLTKISKVKSPWMSHLGIGDLLFFIAIIFLSETVSFILLFILMTFFSLIIGGFGQYLFKWKNVPYAGLSAIVLVFILAMRTFNFQFENYIQSLISY